MCITDTGIPAIFMKTSYSIVYLHNTSLLDQRLIIVPIFYIFLSAASFNTSSGNLSFSPESPELPLLLLQPDTVGSEKERRIEEGW